VHTRRRESARLRAGDGESVSVSHWSVSSNNTALFSIARAYNSIYASGSGFSLFSTLDTMTVGITHCRSFTHQQSYCTLYRSMSVGHGPCRQPNTIGHTDKHLNWRPCRHRHFQPPKPPP
jgi:hypothetical protein